MGNETNYSEVLSGTVGGDAEGLAEDTSGKIGAGTLHFSAKGPIKFYPNALTDLPMLTKNLSIGLALTFISSATVAQSSFVPTSTPQAIIQMVTPNSYKTLPVEARQFYVAGALDMESASQPQVFASIRNCVKGSDLEHLTNVVDKGLITMDTKTLGAMPQNVHNAILLQCGKV